MGRQNEAPAAAALGHKMPSRCPGCMNKKETKDYYNIVAEPVNRERVYRNTIFVRFSLPIIA
jgi:hypothetical protein